MALKEFKKRRLLCPSWGSRSWWQPGVVNCSSEWLLPCCGFAVLLSSLRSREGSAQGMCTSVTQSCLEWYQELESKWAEGAVFSREVHLRVQSAHSGWCLGSWNLSTELLRKSATCPGLSRILQRLARQRRAGFLLQGSLLSPCSFLLEVPGGCPCCCWGSPATHTQLRLWKLPPALRAAAASCTTLGFMQMCLGKALLIILMAVKYAYLTTSNK